MSTPPTLERPTGSESIIVDTGRGRLAAFRMPARGLPAGSERGTALLVPGFTGSKEDFIALLEPVAEAGYAVLAYDQRGQFETGGPDDPADYTMDAFASDLLDLAATVTGPTHLLGHSFGGLVARAAVLRSPTSFASLTLLDSGPGRLVDERQRGRLQMLAAAIVDHGPAPVWQAMRALAEAEGDLGPADPEVAAFLEKRFHANVPAAIAAKARLLLDEPDTIDALRAVAPPVLVMYGEEDDTWAVDEMAEMGRRLGASTVVVEGCGHSPNAERPEETAARLTEFWDSVPVR